MKALRFFLIFSLFITVSFSPAISQEKEKSTSHPSSTTIGSIGEKSENRLRRFEIITLTSIPFTTLHSFLAMRLVKMAKGDRFSSTLGNEDYRAIGISTISSALLVGLWDYFRNRNDDISTPLIEPHNAEQ